MRLVLAAILLAVVTGWLAGGRLLALGRLRVRWWPVAVVGLGLQLAPVPGRTLPLVLLYASFGVLFAFAVANIRVVGFSLILIGLAMNFAVIALNHGMPVSEAALIASDQQNTLTFLLHDGGAKHHLSTPEDRWTFLADVLPIAPIRQVVSLGDLFAYGGVMWLIFSGMRGTPGAVTQVDESGEPSAEAEEPKARRIAV